MSVGRWTVTIMVVGLALNPIAASATPIQSLLTFLGGPTIANFEGFAEGARVSGVPGIFTLDQPFGGGPPMIDNSPFLSGYIASSGSGVLTGATPGAAINATFVIPRSGVEIFLSDLSPEANYSVSAFGATGNLL